MLKKCILNKKVRNKTIEIFCLPQEMHSMIFLNSRIIFIIFFLQLRNSRFGILFQLSFRSIIRKFSDIIVKFGYENIFT